MNYLAAFCLGVLIGAWLALVVRALFADAAADRMRQAAEDALEPEHLARLRGYLAQVDRRETENVLTRVK